MGDAQDFANDVEAVIARQLGRAQEKAARMWQGYEEMAVISIVRALDAVATVGSMDARRELPARRANTRYFAKGGAAAALRPFLRKIHDIPGGVPWIPLTVEVASARRQSQPPVFEKPGRESQSCWMKSAWHMTVHCRYSG